MTKLSFLFFMSILIPSISLCSEPPYQKKDASHCALQLFEAAKRPSDTQAYSDMMTVISECQKKGLPKQVQYSKAHKLAVSKQHELASWRIATQSGREERNYTYHAQTALWTVASAAAAFGTCKATGLCGGKNN